MTPLSQISDDNSSNISNSEVSGLKKERDELFAINSPAVN